MAEQAPDRHLAANGWAMMTGFLLVAYIYVITWAEAYVEFIYFRF